MSTSRERVIRTLNHQPVDQAPRDLWVALGPNGPQADEMAELLCRYPTDIAKPDFRMPRGDREQGRPREAGQYTDAWGCVWQVQQPGTLGRLQHAPLAELHGLDRYQPPWEVLRAADFSAVNRFCGGTSQFVLAWTGVQPFERLQFLRGAEAALADLACATTTIRKLLDLLHDYYLREIEAWAASDVDGVVFLDDWGSQQSLLISPETWRELFKPRYRDYCQILHAHDKYAFFHTDGFIADIFHDLVDVGIDAVNSQLFCMDIESLARHLRGRITFWGEVDRMHTLPLGSPQEVRAAVERVRKALDFGRGGLIAQCEWGPGVRFENVAAVFEAWLQPLLAHA